ncbi:MAG: carbonic anhydrase family protein [Ideonella sp.]|nr:carbonic anhydrase family protein [Ideonella sp.]
MAPPRISSHPILVWCGAALLAGCGVATAATGPAWQYSGEYGPEQWARMRPEWTLCGSGQRQSPVDITSAQRQSGAMLGFHYRPEALRIVNDGHTVRVRYRNGSRLLLGREALTLQQFHFHTPGGDRLNGEDFPVAVHLLHKGASGQLVSLVLLFRLGEPNTALSELLPRMPTRGLPEQTLAGSLFDPSRLLPRSTAHYRYDGSLTAPPCTEGVVWLVMKQPLTLSAAQLAQLKALFPPNARPVQPLHGRVVSEGG